MESVKFLHCSDIHLGSVLNIKSKVSDEVSNKLDNALLNSFERIVELAIKREVDFILIAGDIFDVENLNVKIDKVFSSACYRLLENSVNVYMIAGNHDPLRYKKYLFSLPENVYMFGGKDVENIYYEKNGKKIANIIGVSYEERFLKSDFIKGYNNLSDPMCLNIALLHTSLNSGENYAPCTLEELKKSSINYWALGHIHKNYVLNRENPTIAYSGIPQSRDMGEQNGGGVYLVEFEGEKIVSLEFEEVSEFRYKELEIEVEDNIESVDYLTGIIERKLKEYLDESSQVYIVKLKINIKNSDNFLKKLKSKDQEIIINVLNEGIYELNNRCVVDSIDYIDRVEEKVEIEDEILNYIKDEMLLMKENEETLGIMGEIWTGLQGYSNSENFYGSKEVLEDIFSKVYSNILQELGEW